MKPFITLDGKDKYQDFWMQTRNATIENFQTDLFILNSIRETKEKVLKELNEEEDRILNLMRILNDALHESKGVKNVKEKIE